MTDTSTPSHLGMAVDANACGPKATTLAFLRQFARCYTPAVGGLILN